MTTCASTQLRTGSIHHTLVESKGVPRQDLSLAKRSHNWNCHLGTGTFGGQGDKGAVPKTATGEGNLKHGNPNRLLHVCVVPRKLSRNLQISFRLNRTTVGCTETSGRIKVNLYRLSLKHVVRYVASVTRLT